MNAPGFTGSTLDRADRLRHDAEAFAAAKRDPAARLLRLDGLEPEVDGEGRLGWRPLAEAAADAEQLFLGFDAGVPCFAAWAPGDRARSPHAGSMWRLLDALRPDQAATYAAARSLIDWHSRHRFCANCGSATAIFRAGWARRCPSCAAEHFPRTDPVVIMIAEHEGRALLGRQPSWPPGRYSALAGFVEVGESIEEAVRRETEEEAGVRVGRVRYVASQPWPFPSSLMIACIGEAEGDALRIDTNELETAIWVDREGVRAALAGEEGAAFLPPPRYAIAHTLLTAWLEG